MRTNGRDHHSVNVGRQNRAVGGQRVSRRAGGGGDDDSVGAEAGHALAVQLDGEIAHAGNVALGDDDLIQRFITKAERAPAPQFGVQHGARIQVMVAAVPALQRWVEVGQPNLGQEAEKAQVHAEDGRAG